MSFGVRHTNVLLKLFSGVSYIIDQRRGNCSITNISSIGFDVHSIDPSHVRIRTAKEFFYFDKTQYNYEGTVNITTQLLLKVNCLLSPPWALSLVKLSVTGANTLQ